MKKKYDLEDVLPATSLKGAKFKIVAKHAKEHLEKMIDDGFEVTAQVLEELRKPEIKTEN